MTEKESKILVEIMKRLIKQEVKRYIPEIRQQILSELKQSKPLSSQQPKLKSNSFKNPLLNEMMRNIRPESEYLPVNHGMIPDVHDDPEFAGKINLNNPNVQNVVENVLKKDYRGVISKLNNMPIPQIRYDQSFEQEDIDWGDE